MSTFEGPMYGQPVINMTSGKNGYRLFFIGVTGPADAMRAGDVVVAHADGSDRLVRLGDVMATGAVACCTDFKVLACHMHIGSSLRVVDENTKRFQGLHIECDRCETLVPYSAGMTLEAMGATA
jgi:hypothetical protein